ncbi:hypothetical protein [Kosmotoga pacifica]|nr:hypothetical protein [Kosmotoga pacifica]
MNEVEKHFSSGARTSIIAEGNSRISTRSLRFRRDPNQVQDDR